MTEVHFTHIGGPTTLIEVGGWRLLTDPTFDPPGRRYTFGWGTGSRKLTGPAASSADLGRIDAVLLSHDHHADNLDAAGRALLPTAGAVITTVPGAARLGGSARGLRPFATTELRAPERDSIAVTATPARHGPLGSRPLAGAVIGFLLQWPGQQHGALWISGDTVLYRGVRSVLDRFRIGTVVVHLGGVQFPITGPVEYSMTARDAIELCRLARPRTVIPVHYEGWSHFQEPMAEMRAEFARAPAAVQESIRWLPLGAPTAATV